VLAADQFTKYLADEYLSYGQPVTLLPIFDLTLLYNEGAAFSLLADAGGWQRWLFIGISTLVSVVLGVWLMRLKQHEWLLGTALALVLGGALGNLYDRATLGYVIDFISLHYQAHYFPAFNLADAAITAGALLLILDLFITREVKE